MKVDGFTCCVGPEYQEYLTESLPIWTKTLNTVTVVTKPNDLIVKQKGKYKNLKFVETDVFTRYNAHFNKGAALCEAFAAANPTEWCLHFDSDIVPPSNWLDIANRRAEKGCLSGVFRYNEQGERLDEKPLYPYGYFHLWHISDPNCWRWPLFGTWFAHAGSYDANFTDHWRPSQRRDLGFRVIHRGECRTNWFGPGARRERMKELLRKGLRNVRITANETGVGRLPIPEPKLKLWFNPNASRSRSSNIIKEAMKYGPFHIWIECSNRSPGRGWEQIGSVTELKRYTACLK